MNPAETWNQRVAGVGPSPELFLDQVRAAGVTYGAEGRALCRYRRPVFVTEALVKRYVRILGAFHQAVRLVREMLVDDGLGVQAGVGGGGGSDSLAERIGIAPEALALANLPSGYASAAVLARLDSFCVDGHPWFIELNAESPAGMAYGDALADLFLADPAGQDGQFSAMRAAPLALRAMTQVYRGVRGERAPPPRLAIVDFREVPTAAEFALFQRQAIALGMPCAIVDPRELSFDGQHLRARGEMVDLVYRRLLIDDVITRPGDVQALVDAVRARAVVMVNSFRTALLHGKGLFAMLHDPMVLDLLPEAAQRAVVEHIPWTGILSETPGVGAPAGLRERVRREPERWVLKPMTGHGGSGVLLGDMVSATEWERAVDEAVGCVVQRRLRLQTQRFPDADADYALVDRIVSLDPYLVRGRLAGFLSRVSVGPIGNVSCGASQVPVFVVPGGPDRVGG